MVGTEMTEPVQVIFFQWEEGDVPVLKAILGLQAKAQDKCFAKIERLEMFGHTLRRPDADILDDGIYELRIRVGTIQYRILYFFHGQEAVVLAHFIVKEKKVPRKDIERAKERREVFLKDPEAHSFIHDEDNEEKG